MFAIVVFIFFCRGLDIRVSKVMYPDILHSGFRYLAFHFMLNRFLHDWEKSFIVRHTIVTVNKILNFLFQKLRDFNRPYRLLCFRFCNNVLPARWAIILARPLSSLMVSIAQNLTFPSI